MADTDLTIPLKHPQLRTFNVLTESVHHVYFAITSVVGLAAICMLALPWGPAFAMDHPNIGLIAIAVLAATLLIGATIKVARASCSDELLINRDGLNLPLMVARINKANIWQSWIGVTAATITSGDNNERNLLLSTKSGTAIDIPLSGMDTQAIEQLLLSIELWGVNCTREQSLFDYQSELHNQSKGLSYTDMWNDELGRRFSSTTFVPLEPETKLQSGRLKVLRQLAFGGLSAIYLVQDGQKELRVLKEAVVPESMEVTNRDAAEKSLRREATILGQLNHNHIVSVLDHFSEAGHHYLLLEHVVGQDLRQLVRQHGPQSEAKVLDWAVQILSALEYLHTYEPPIIHRDLTPENIVLRNDGTIIIIDFGASNQFLGTMTGTIIGKQAYMAPEQLQGKATTQSDIYAFGGTLHYLLTGKDPVPLSETHPASLATVSPALDELVSKCTKLGAADRYQSAAKAKTDLVAIYSEQGIGKLFTDT
ncbi:hypothetical protein BH10CYA1_BH10CYA1_44410 [soil metagenome]